ncbi:MAG: S9 family peptidase, partial [Acidimicrobiales bacterium]
SRAGPEAMGASAEATSHDVQDVISRPWSARSMVHEYGGLSYAVHDSVVFFVHQGDQRLYRVDAPGTTPQALTPEPPAPRSVRFGAPLVSPDGAWLYAVRERHQKGSDRSWVLNDLVVVPTDGDPRAEPETVVGGHDFVSAPVLCPDGKRLCICCWEHPDMPWDESVLFEGYLDAHGRLGPLRPVAGGDGESISQPRYGPDGSLFFISDRSGWWNIYRDDGKGGARVLELEAEFAYPDWLLGQRSYDVLADGSIIASWSAGGFGHLGLLHPVVDDPSGPFELREIESDFVAIDFVHAGRSEAGAPFAVIVASSSSVPSELVEVDLAERDFGRCQSIFQLTKPELAPLDVSSASPVEFVTDGGSVAHALYFPPLNHQFEAPAGELPPLVVISHGGPTGSSSPRFSLDIQFFTTRGFAVAAVDYRGSAGYGRAYRRLLEGRWGLDDVSDCVLAAEHLAEKGLADPRRLVIRGGSAGGYCVLRCVTTTTCFAAGSSHYGVADVGALAAQTHKFEAFYCDRLIAPWPEGAQEYRLRSPLFATGPITTPTILFQGLDDKVVPPSQAATMAEVLRRGAVPCCSMIFEGEGHGFRRAETISAVARSELGFFEAFLDLVPPDAPPPEIHNLGPHSPRSRRESDM